MSNPNTLYANTFIDALIASGLRSVCIAPGSRHTALVLALARHRDEIDLYSHLDERSAAFFALGLALGSDEPAAIVCTSGSAAANFFPAIVEAHQSRVPLIALTADRPHELRHSGANQTIDQIKLYGDYVDWFVDAPLPAADPPAVALRHLSTLAARAFNTSKRKRGVVHINLPFRKPFEPSARADELVAFNTPATTKFVEERAKRESGLSALLADDLLARPGIIYFGHGSCRSEAERAAITPWAERLSAITGYPIFAEFTSNMRRGCTIGAYESLVDANADRLSQAEVLIRFGSPPLAKNMQDFMHGNHLRYHIYCSRAGEWADDSHSVSHHLTVNPAKVSVDEWDGWNSAAPRDQWSQQWQAAERAARQVIADQIKTGEYFDGAVLHDIVNLMPAESALFVGNSLPIRHLDQFGMPREKPIFVYANRGASGIDGNVSTALGIGAARRGKPLVAVLGDITLYHDLNGLLAIRRCGVPVTIVLLNNEGGGIFHRLPAHEFEPHFSDFFITAHGLDFRHAAALYDLEYILAGDRAAFRAAFRDSVGGSESTLIEVRTDAVDDLRRRNEIMAAARERLNAAF
ncbi:MAG: 2-succinyl-5-enolpyruvyl-6-hydroxy-3-cyclohexene-1-carboxylic-acid synthase [Chloroflexi bacterium]|nr:2-succinyl-5-enolpyruvyl-6-hydroxy-3-cyclohexene-1-carboxylic-acid synthase [Chloroflexota bacterium]